MFEKSINLVSILNKTYGIDLNTPNIPNQLVHFEWPNQSAYTTR